MCNNEKLEMAEYLLLIIIAIVIVNFTIIIVFVAMILLLVWIIAQVNVIFGINGTSSAISIALRVLLIPNNRLPVLSLANSRPAF